MAGGQFDTKRVVVGVVADEAKDAYREAKAAKPDAEKQTYAGLKGLETELGRVSLLFPKGRTALGNDDMQAILKVLDKPETRAQLNRDGQHVLELRVQGGKLLDPKIPKQGLTTAKRVAALEAFVKGQLDGGAVAVNHSEPAKGSDSLDILNIAIVDHFEAARKTPEGKGSEGREQKPPRSREEYDLLKALENKDLSITLGAPLVGAGKFLVGLEVRNPVSDRASRVELGGDDKGFGARYVNNKTVAEVGTGRLRGDLNVGAYVGLERDSADRMMDIEVAPAKTTISGGAQVEADFGTRQGHLKLETEVGLKKTSDESIGLDLGIRATATIPLYLGKKSK
jgi:hypothetical protein